MNVRVRRALLSVSDTTGLVPFARALARRGVELWATSGTASTLAKAGLRVRKAEELTGFGDLLDGRVKTIHPAIAAGILAVRTQPTHMRTLRKEGWPQFDLVAVNLYAHEPDIGGVTMLRAAAKNWEGVAAVPGPDHYAAVLADLASHGGALCGTRRRRLAAAAFAVTAGADAALAAKMALNGASEPFHGDARAAGGGTTGVLPLRYGENPHQSGAALLVNFSLLQGKPLSYTNILDADAAWRTVQGVAGRRGRPSGRPAVACVVKHTNPCGVATGRSLSEAYRAAFDADAQSAFGGVAGLNRPCDAATARAVTSHFTELLIAPAVAPAARRILAARPNLRVVIPSSRVLRTDSRVRREALSSERSYDVAVVGAGLAPAPSLRSTALGLLVQRDTEPKESWRVVTKRRPTPAETRALKFAWTVAAHVKSNAAVFATTDRTVGIGAGQMSRVDAVRVAAMKLAQHVGAGPRGQRAIQVGPVVLASDGFFPFPDGVEEAARAGATAVIQPGGSIRDGEVIAAADRHRVAMVVTGVRRFRH